jgi:hypothetical protein
MSVAMRATANVDVVYNLAADMGGMLDFLLLKGALFGNRRHSSRNSGDTSPFIDTCGCGDYSGGCNVPFIRAAVQIDPLLDSLL